ncbi:jg19927 [Pararge aegeria aegeria]|uniref:Jg19926 protein n=1 Tax=Pararge aegeria aegeria TaxID=348720 RepID=A0A8S4S6S5_9NEOP|nr:jg19926 [Pararge aegeria aegeria]CAH2258236.1 jg19927 [Pararge aegeria aegeria]
MGLCRRLRVTHRAIEIAMLGVLFKYRVYDQIRNKEIRRRSYRPRFTRREAEVVMGGQGAGMAALASVALWTDL